MTGRKIMEIDKRIRDNATNIKSMQDDIFMNQTDTIYVKDNIVRQREELDGEIRFLKRLAGGLMLIAGIMGIALAKSKADIREIQKAMNEG